VRSEIIVHNTEISKKWIDRMADAGITVMGIHPVGGRKAHLSLAELVEQMKSPEYRELIDYAQSRGLEIEYELHAAGYLLPRKLFETNPEYFRTDTNGERSPDWNFCVSNPAALGLVSKRAAELALSLYGSGNKFYFWMDDGRNTHCHCKKCATLSPSDQQLTVLNAMLREIRKHIPDAKLAYLAYIDSIVLPQKVKPVDGIFLEYAPFEKYTNKSENAHELIARELDMLKPLLDFFGKTDAKVLEYWYDNSLFSGWKKPPKPFTLNKEGMETDIKMFKEMGFDSIATFGCFLGEDYEELYGDVDITPFARELK